MVQIVTDSTADLGPVLTEQYRISTVPLYVFANNRVYTDGVDVTINDLFHSVQTTGQLPKTSAPPVSEFQKLFSQPGEHIFIGLSGQLSATIQNAILAQQTCEPGRVYIIDGRSVSSGTGLLVLKAAELRDQGLPAEVIYRQISALVPKVRALIVIETLDYLYKGGRCSAIQNLMGGLLHIRPVITVRPDGTLGVKGRTRGTRQKALQFILDDFTENLQEINLERVFVTHTGCDRDAEMLKTELLKIAPIQNMLITYAGSVIASHCGPDTIGILYTLK